MRKHGFFLGLLETLFEFYEGVFKLTVFLPFTLLQAWQLSRTGRPSSPPRRLQLERSLSPDDHNVERPGKVSWDKDAEPKHSILKTTQEESGGEAREDIANKLELIGREIERISDLLTERTHESGDELEIELRSVSFQDLRNVFQQKSQDINKDEAGVGCEAPGSDSRLEVEEPDGKI